MHDVAENRRQFKIERDAAQRDAAQRDAAQRDAAQRVAPTPEAADMKKIQQATRIYHEEEMKALEQTEEKKASV